MLWGMEGQTGGKLCIAINASGTNKITTFKWLHIFNFIDQSHDMEIQLIINDFQTFNRFVSYHMQ